MKIYSPLLLPDALVSGSQLIVSGTLKVGGPQGTISGSQNLRIENNAFIGGTLEVDKIQANEITGSLEGTAALADEVPIGGILGDTFPNRDFIFPADVTGSQNLHINGTGSFDEGVISGKDIFVDANRNIKDLGEVDTVYYVSPNGNDNNNGRTLENAVRTIGKAVELATVQINNDYQGPGDSIHFNNDLRISIQVKSGNYVEEGPIRVPAYVSILGDDLRTVLVSPTEETRGENLFKLNRGCYVSGLRLTGCEVDDLEDPRTGFFFAFDEGAFIDTSPYVQNCSAVHTPQDKFFAPLDPMLGPDGEPDIEEGMIPNPEVGIGPGGMLVDDSVLNPYSPLRSMVLDAYTQVAFNGIGFCVRGRGFCQLVSFFTNFSRVGVYAIDGGHAALLNSNTTFGDYGLRSKGSRILVEPDISGVSGDTFESASTTVSNNKEDIIDDLIDNFQDRGDLEGAYNNPATVAATRTDAGILIDSIVQDLTTEKPTLISRFTQGFFLGQDTTESNTRTLNNGVVVAFDPNLTSDFIESYDVIEDYIQNSILPGDSSLSKIQQILNVPRDTLEDVIINEVEVENSDGVLSEFGSLITSTAHDFSFAGSGVNFQGLPSTQGGVGQTNLDIRNFEEDGGRVFVNGGDETGDFVIGEDFVIRQETGTIEGRTFARSLFALVTPFFLALEQID